MARIRNTKVAASTLVEVLISMVIIMAVFVTGIAIYVNVTQSGFSVSELKAQKEMENLVQESILNKDWQDQDVLKDSIDYHKTVKPYPGYTGVVLIEVEAKQGSRSLGIYRQLVKEDRNETSTSSQSSVPRSLF